MVITFTEIWRTLILADLITKWQLAFYSWGQRFEFTPTEKQIQLVVRETWDCWFANPVLWPLSWAVSLVWCFVCHMNQQFRPVNSWQETTETGGKDLNLCGFYLISLNLSVAWAAHTPLKEAKLLAATSFWLGCNI